MYNPIFTSLYDLIAQYIFGTVEAGTYQDLVTILIATAGSIFVVSLPFVVVLSVIKMITGWR